MPTDYFGMGKRIRNLRLQYKLTQECLAEKCDLSPSFIGHIEMGTRIPSLNTVMMLAEALHTSLDYLVYGPDFANNLFSFSENAQILPEEVATEMSRLLFRHHTALFESNHIK